MSAHKHTPGPWTFELRNDVGQGPAAFGVVVGPAGKSDWVADVGLLHDDFCSGSKANARLIAAAPELLDACEKALSVILCAQDVYGHGGEDDAAVDAINAAIKKATGEA